MIYWEDSKLQDDFDSTSVIQHWKKYATKLATLIYSCEWENLGLLKQ